MKIERKLFFTEPYRSRAEEKFCEKKLEERGVLLAFGTYAATLLLVLVVPLISFFGVSDRRHFDEILWSHIATGLLLLTRPIFKKMGVKLAHYMAPVSMFYVFGLAWTIRVDIANGYDHVGPVMLTAFVMIGFLIMTPIMNYFLQFIFSMYCFLVMAWGLGQSSDYRVTLIVFANAIISIFWLKNMMWREANYRCMQQFRARSRHIPENILTKAAISGRPINELFAPTKRECICICSDWRNYQALTNNMNEESLASLLSNYYARVNALISLFVPSGNYFSDWIADELFIVLYVDGEANRLDELAKQAVKLSRGIIQVRQDIWQLHKAPEAIDFGIAAGTAFVGIIGPEGHTKATALGELPGRARRIQTFGKHLRTLHGDKDRIIFGEDVLRLVRDAAGPVEVAAVDGQLRNVSDTKLFYL